MTEVNIKLTLYLDMNDTLNENDIAIFENRIEKAIIETKGYPRVIYALAYDYIVNEKILCARQERVGEY